MEGGLGVFTTLVARLPNLTYMLGHSCAHCVALFGEVRSAVNQAKSIAQDAGVLSRAGIRTIEGINEWWEITERWENVRRRWSDASTDFKNHRNTPGHARFTYGHLQVPLNRARRCCHFR
jgi:hypothetical protein